MVKFDRGMLGSIPFAAHGAGPPLVVLAGLSPSTGVASSMVVQGALDPVRHLSASRRLIVLNRRPDLPENVTMSALADEHAAALKSEFDGPVDVIGSSTGGSIAQQLAADHPGTVRRLALVSSACRLGRYGRSVQRQVAAELRAGRNRAAVAAASGGLVPSGCGRHLAAAAGWVAASHIITSTGTAADLALTIEAEDGFDLARCADAIQARTLIVAGERDRFYSRDLFAETAALIPDSRLRLIPRRGHITVTRAQAARAELAAFFGAP